MRLVNHSIIAGSSQPHLLRPTMALVGLTLALPFPACLTMAILSHPEFGISPMMYSLGLYEFGVAGCCVTALPLVIAAALLTAVASGR